MHKKQTLYLFSSLVFIFYICNSAWALNLPPIPSQYVYDEANIIAPDKEAFLNHQLSQLEKQSTTQVVVAVVNSLQGTSIEDYSIRLAEKWKPGQKDKDNGVILLVAPNERKVRIEVGYGLEATLTDALSSEIIQGEIIPEFKSGNMEAGIVQGVKAIIQVVHGEYKASASHYSRKKEKWSPLNFLFFCGPFTPFLILLIIAQILGRRGYTYTGHHGSGGWSSGSSGSSWGGGGGFSSGGGSFGGGGSSGSW